MTLRSRLIGATILGISMLVLAGAHTWAAKGGKGGGKPKPPSDPADPAIAYVLWGRRGPSSLMVMNADGSNQTEIYQSDDSYFGPVSWSPDGKHIAYNEDLEIWRIDVDIVDGVPTGSNRRPLVTDTHVVSPRWSPLGDRILYCTLAFGGNAIMAVPAAGGTPETLYTGLNIQLPTWSPEGQRIAFVERTTVKILDLTTGTVSTVRELPGADFDSLDWARTQDVLAYDLGGTDKIYTLDLGSREITEIGSGAHVSWSPEDDFLIFSGVKTYEFATGDIRKLSRGGRNPDWLR